MNGTKEDYLSSMRTIFEACQNSGSEVIFLTPNMLNTYVAEDVAEVSGEDADSAEGNADETATENLDSGVESND